MTKIEEKQISLNFHKRMFKFSTTTVETKFFMNYLNRKQVLPLSVKESVKLIKTFDRNEVTVNTSFNSRKLKKYTKYEMMESLAKNANKRLITMK
jgi:hypothetical protein